MTLFKSTMARLVTVFAFILSLAAFNSAPAMAQSACKGLSKSACTSNSRCSHVAAFTRSDGARVKAFCRSKPGNGAKKKAKTSSDKKKVATKRSSTTTKSAKKKTSTKKTTAKKSTSSTRKTAVAKKKPVKKKKKSTAKKPAKKKKKSTAGTS